VANGEADATIATVDVQDYLIRQQGLDNMLLANKACSWTAIPSSG